MEIMKKASATIMTMLLIGLMSCQGLPPIAYAYMDETNGQAYSESVEEETVSTDNIERIGIVYTEGSRLNVRSGSGLEYAVITQLIDGERVKVLEEGSDWIHVIIPEKEGYVYTDYLNVVDETREEQPDTQEIISFPQGQQNEVPDGTPNISNESDVNQPGETLVDTLPEDNGRQAGLTPEGNLTLVDDLGPVSEKGQQIITVTTRKGNYFYLIVDRDEEGSENVHFLNQVDEADLFSLLDEEEEKALREEREALQASLEAEVAALSEELQKEREASLEASVKSEQTAAEQSGNTGLSNRTMTIMAILLLTSVAGIAAAAYLYLKPRKKEEQADPDDDYKEDDDDEEY